MYCGVSHIRVVTLTALVAAAFLPLTARAAEKARITGLSDVNFGLIAGFGDKSISQSVCAYTSSKTELYSVTASGNGPGGTFSISSGASQLPYDVLWADAPNLQSGTTLTENVAASGFISSEKQQTCNGGAPTTASLTIVLRDAVLRNARAGSYSGGVQVTIAPE